MTHQERLAARKRVWRAALDAEGVSEPAAALFGKVNYGGLCDAEQLPGACLYCHVLEPVTENQCRAALADCFARGWLQVVDEAALGRLAAELRDGGILGPVYGLPRLGAIDFTHAGATIWQRLLRHADPDPQPEYPFSDVVHRKVSYYFCSLPAARAWVAEARTGSDDVVGLSGPHAVGPWRLQWWRRFPHGYRVDVETRTQWDGSCGKSTGWYLGRGCSKRWRPDPDRLQRILDSRNVAIAEWLLLALVGDLGGCHRTSLSDGASRWAARDFGFVAVAEDCEAALADCVRHGWLIVSDGTPPPDARELLRTDTALAPVPAADRFGWNEVTFTATGAALYRTLAAAFAGPDWEDDLCVYSETYREEHRYCAGEESFPAVEEELARNGEVPRVTRVVPLGPWCVYWWARFARGFRMELEIGEPVSP